MTKFRGRNDRLPKTRFWKSVLSLAMCAAIAEFPVSVTAVEPMRPAGADVAAELKSFIEADWLAADLRWIGQKSATMRSPRINEQGIASFQDAAGGVDGVKTGRWGFHVAVQESDPWWQVDLGKDRQLDRVVVYNRTDGGQPMAARTRGLQIHVAREASVDEFTVAYQHDGSVFYGVREQKPLVIRFTGRDVTARIVRVLVPGTCSLALDEVEVYAAQDPDRNIALGRPADQKSVSRHSVAHPTHQIPENAPRIENAFSFEHTCEVIRRARALAARFTSTADAARLNPLLAELRTIERRLAAREAPVEARRELHFEARWLARRVAFANPLLNFDRLLFLKRRHPGGVFHICDQYYGFSAAAGGGLYVLEQPFTEQPRLVNLLDKVVVENGRFRGRTLKPGSFLSPDVSYDGRTILFAYTENNEPEDASVGEERMVREWTRANCHHVFGIQSDGSRLRQLTDGPWDDFDPCFLPSGRIAFISERRGGFVRCGVRACRSFNLHSMQPDGGNIVALSYHDTNEWHPSVNNDGLLVYTRWDYIDRDTQCAHHLWLCSPDGRDPRAPHGNYPVHLKDRPWAEMDIRAIPGSERYVATAGPHHGHALGTLVLIDLRKADDAALAQVERLTPEIPFPEGEADVRSSQVYGTAWPLSEDDYLCAYDAQAKNHGIYWIDRAGNRELIYRDADIPSLSPIPLRPRPAPPVVPERTTRTWAASQAAVGGPPVATVALLNVYESDFRWPTGAKIAALRILQILPKSTPSRNKPKIGIAEQSNARAVLGTVPVEADGSAFFDAPVGKLLAFQALDAQGTAVQSMRTGTYLHPGENLACRGCHEPQQSSAAAAVRPRPLALNRPPSAIHPDVEGSNPFNYVRLVQPALDRNCVECHRQRGALDLSGVVEYRLDRDKNTQAFTRSYLNLAGSYGFWFETLIDALENGGPNGGQGGSRTTAGQFGAGAAKLTGYLNEGHYGVRLTREDFHRITLWLDCNSEFLGAYELADAQAHGQPVAPSLD